MFEIKKSNFYALFYIQCSQFIQYAGMLFAINMTIALLITDAIIKDTTYKNENL